MKVWTRRSPLEPLAAGPKREEWEYRDGSRRLALAEVDVTIGKPLDVLALKGASLPETVDYARFLRETASRLRSAPVLPRLISACPACDAATDSAAEVLTVYGISYKACTDCGHVFVGAQPARETLDQLFRESDAHAATYTDRASLEARLSQVVRPKLEWMIEVYRRRIERNPRALLDVGAGGGHFVAVARERGLHADGYEISRASRRFAHEVFGIDLRESDFLETRHFPGEFDLVTFWGLLEYTPEPERFLSTARRMLDPQSGMLVVEVPRFAAISSAIQALCPDRVARHLDPTSHVNCFSDASLATLLHRTGFTPVAAWYFGMDAYELLMQLALELDVEDGLARLARLLPGLQAAFDAARLCDDLILAAVPVA